jgi:glycosyltransferase involved in cell wall biosynthesis
MNGTSAPFRQLLYVRPAFGGIFDYSESILGILRTRLPGTAIEVVTARSQGDPIVEGIRLAREIEARDGVVCVDIGSNDAAMLWALLRVSRVRRVLVTIHDPGVVVGGLLRSRRVGALSPLAKRIAESAAFRLERRFGPSLIRWVLHSCAGRLVLNSSVRSVLGVAVEYLPQPVYGQQIIPHLVPEPPRVAYLGYWGRVKGIEELLASYQQLAPRFPGVQFLIAGGGVSADDTYARQVRDRVAAGGLNIELPGFIPPGELDEFLRGLTALVLPYHPELAGGASAMLMRAQEAGVPLVISDTPMLRAQVDVANVTLVAPRDVASLTAGISDVLTNATHHNARARAEQLRVHRDHGKPVVGDRLLEILGRVQAR